MAATVGSGIAQIQDGLKKLRVRWDETRETWADGVRQDFEKNFVDPLELETRQAVQAMEQLAVLLAAAIRESRSTRPCMPVPVTLNCHNFPNVLNPRAPR